MKQRVEIEAQRQLIAAMTAEKVANCPGRGEHVRLAHRAEQAELKAAGLAPVVQLRPVSLGLLEPRGDEGA